MAMLKAGLLLSERQLEKVVGLEDVERSGGAGEQ